MTAVELFRRKRSTLLALAIAVLLILGVALPAYDDHVATQNMLRAVAFSDTWQHPLEAACASGRFDFVQTPADLQRAPSEPGAFVLRTDIAHAGPGKLLLTFVLDDYGPAWSEINRFQRNLVIEYACGADGKLSAHPSPRSTVNPLHLPVRLRP